MIFAFDIADGRLYSLAGLIAVVSPKREDAESGLKTLIGTNLALLLSSFILVDCEYLQFWPGTQDLLIFPFIQSHWCSQQILALGLVSLPFLDLVKAIRKRSTGDKGTKSGSYANLPSAEQPSFYNYQYPRGNDIRRGPAF